MKKHLVIGASGTVGSHIVDLLAREGRPVRATTSRLAAAGRKDGVEWTYADLVTGFGLIAAFDGIDSAFLMAPPGHADQYRLLWPLILQAKRSKQVEKVVLMTAMGANMANTPFRQAEEELKASGLRYNIIRPNWFMQNFTGFWSGGIREEGRIRLPVGDGKASFIDARDVAAVAARLLTTNDQDDRDFDLTGPQALDHAAVARIIAQATGRRVLFEDIEPEAMRKGLLAAGLPGDYAEFLVGILVLLKEGHAERTTDAVRDLLGREPIRFERFAREHRDAWARAA